MNHLAKEAIERIYANGDRQFYRTRSLEKISLPQEVHECVKNWRLTMVEFYTAKTCWPSKKWNFCFPKVQKGEFKAEFNTILLVSKLAPLFHVQHEFTVDNQSEERIRPLDGFFEQSFIQPQFQLGETLTKAFNGSGYARLTYAEMNEVVCDLSFPPGVTIFGPQVTVQYALFHDLLGICTET
jgi:hypothetical protein